MNKKILILNTGGTISAIKSAQGYIPLVGYISQALANINALQHPDMPQYIIKEYQPLLDSSNMTVSDWNKIATDIAQHYDEVDGFVIFHGTDTLSYSATALSFMLENLSKPVILTGSQIPLSEARNDAFDNIFTSLWLCAHEPLTEVCIYFDQCLLRGNRSQKVSTQRFRAFDSPNFPHLSDIGINISLKKNLLRAPADVPFRLQLIDKHLVANVRLFPGFEVSILDHILQQPIDGLILETYGIGNAPNHNPRFLQLLKEATDRGVVIVNCSQCVHGHVDMSQYATGGTLKDAGLISGQDMTLEAAHCKLLYLLSKYSDKATIRSLMETNLCGELSD